MDEPEADFDVLAAARGDVAAAIARYADGWSNCEGGLVVAFVAVAEVAAPDGNLVLVEVAGSGPDGERGLEIWRRDGFLHYSLRKTHDDVEPPDPDD